MNQPSAAPALGRNYWGILLVSPAAVLLLLGASYLVLKPYLPESVVRHMGPDGDGYGALGLFVLSAGLIAAGLFAIAGPLAHGYIKRGHWFTTEKFISVSLLAGGYGVVAVGLCTILINLGAAEPSAGERTVGLSLLGFIAALVSAAVIYAKVLPRARFESESEA